MQKPVSLLLFGLLSLSLMPHTSQAQRFGYMDSQVILDKLPAYQEAKEEIDRFAQNWQKDIDRRQKALDSLRLAFARDEMLLTPEMKLNRLEEIDAKEVELRDFQANTFGYRGLLFLKQQELMEPIREQVAKAAERVARKNKIAIIFDKAGDMVMLYTDPRLNYNEEILKVMKLIDPEEEQNTEQTPSEEDDGN